VLKKQKETLGDIGNPFLAGSQNYYYKQEKVFQEKRTALEIEQAATLKAASFQGVDV